MHAAVYGGRREMQFPRVKQNRRGVQTREERGRKGREREDEFGGGLKTHLQFRLNGGHALIPWRGDVGEINKRWIWRAPVARLLVRISGGAFREASASNGSGPSIFFPGKTHCLTTG